MIDASDDDEVESPPPWLPLPSKSSSSASSSNAGPPLPLPPPNSSHSSSDDVHDATNDGVRVNDRRVNAMVGDGRHPKLVDEEDIEGEELEAARGVEQVATAVTPAAVAPIAC